MLLHLDVDLLSTSPCLMHHAGEYPRPELRSQARISGACMDAALGFIPSLTIKGTKHNTSDGTCECHHQQASRQGACEGGPALPWLRVLRLRWPGMRRLALGSGTANLRSRQ